MATISAGTRIQIVDNGPYNKQFATVLVEADTAVNTYVAIRVDGHGANASTAVAISGIRILGTCISYPGVAYDNEDTSNQAARFTCIRQPVQDCFEGEGRGRCTAFLHYFYDATFADILNAQDLIDYAINNAIRVDLVDPDTWESVQTFDPLTAGALDAYLQANHSPIRYDATTGNIYAKRRSNNGEDFPLFFLGPPPAIIEDGVRESTRRLLPDARQHLTFSRNIVSYNADGSDVAANEVRRTKEVTYFPRIQWEDAATVESAANFLGAGVDYDNNTLVFSTYNTGDGVFRTYRGSMFEKVTEVSIAGDVMQGAISGETYFPRAIVIHCGLMVMKAERRKSNTPVGLALLHSTDYGATWTRIPDVSGVPYVPVIAGDASEGVNRGQPWSFSAAFPVTDGSDLTDVFVPWADYQFKTDNPKGGQAGMFRATRASSTSPDWVVQPSRVLLEEWNEDDPGGGGRHFHAAAPNSLGLIVHQGDVDYRNAVYQVTFDVANYQTAPIQGSEIIFGGYTEDFDLSLVAPQPVATVPGPDFGSHIASVDESWELIQVFPDRTSASDDLIMTSPLLSTRETAIGSILDGFASLNMHYIYGGGYASVGDSLFMMSRDGVNWGFGHRPSNGGRWTFPLAEYIVNYDTSSGEIKRARWPQATTTRAIDIKCGGFNNKVQRGDAPYIAEISSPAGGGESDFVVWDGSDWVYYATGLPVPENDELKAAGDPPFGYTYTLVRQVPGTSRTMSRIWLHNDGNSVNLDTALNPHVMSWLFVPASQRRGISKSWKFGTEGGSSTQGSEKGHSMSLVQQWVPWPYRFDQSNTENDRPWVIEYSPADNEDTNPGVVHYSVTTAAGNDIVGVSYPFPRGSENHPVEDAVMAVPDTSDAYMINMSLYVATDVYWASSDNPVVTLWQDADNYVEVILRKTLFRATATVATVTGADVDAEIDFFRDQCCDICLTKDDDNNLKMFGAFPSNAATFELDLGTTDIVPTEVRFSNNDKSLYQPIAIMGVHYVPSVKTEEEWLTFISKSLETR